MKPNFKHLEVTGLTAREMRHINGGYWPFIAAALTIYGAINVLAYNIGYLAGTIQRELEQELE
ncbi:MAG TPA: hypothetical protein PLR06_13000 [Cyclobacteriaceae bacterium]|nr:hypothetical protein [Cyclobacteriaceae bacterium]